MSTQAPQSTVRRTVTVDAPVEHAFRVFTDGIGTWWNKDHHLLGEEVAEMVFEPRAGGHIIDRGVSGAELRWARVLVYDPPHAVAFSWDIGVDWRPSSDPGQASEVHVTFTEEAPERTLVVLEHRHLERHGEGWESMRDAVGSGWDLAPYAAAVAARV